MVVFTMIFSIPRLSHNCCQQTYRSLWSIKSTRSQLYSHEKCCQMANTQTTMHINNTHTCTWNWFTLSFDTLLQTLHVCSILISWLFMETTCFLSFSFCTMDHKCIMFAFWLFSVHRPDASWRSKMISCHLLSTFTYRLLDIQNAS